MEDLSPLDSRVLAHLQRREAVYAASTEGAWASHQYTMVVSHSRTQRVADVSGHDAQERAANSKAIAVSHNSTPADLAVIRALLDMYCFCVSNQDELLCHRCAALATWADAMDQQAVK